ncbi:MAG: flagellar hook-length control protein FliK [Alphaproteobacteria bacterium]|uniref:Flagellar hook-length control protein FliK n=1 Tax=Candidatus Nitrobium versatile TaxID=2884831 RepID=A0A953JCR0_9BACT|nr:flagellar hook-length control protein FliK [Candidatus Nitrobium versatile]
MAAGMIQMNMANTMQSAAGTAGAPGAATTALIAAPGSPLPFGETLAAPGGAFVALLQAMLTGEKGALSSLADGFTLKEEGEIMAPGLLTEEMPGNGEVFLDGEMAAMVQQLMVQMHGGGMPPPVAQAAGIPGAGEGSERYGIQFEGESSSAAAVALQAGESAAKEAALPVALPLTNSGAEKVQGATAVSVNEPGLQNEAVAPPAGPEEAGAFRLEAGAAPEITPGPSGTPGENAAPRDADPLASSGEDALVQGKDGDGRTLLSAEVGPEEDSAPGNRDAASPATASLPASTSAEYGTKGVSVVKEALPLHRVNELGEAAAKAAESGAKNLIVKLDPPDLGSIQIKLRMENGVLTADIRVESPATRDMFSLAVPQIRASLEDSGIKVGGMWVDHQEDFYSDGRERQGNADQQRNQQQKQTREERPRFFEYFA